MDIHIISALSAEIIPRIHRTRKPIHRKTCGDESIDRKYLVGVKRGFLAFGEALAHLTKAKSREGRKKTLSLRYTQPPFAQESPRSRSTS